MAAEMAAGLAPHVWDGAWDKNSADWLGNDGIASGVRSDSSYFGDIPTHRPARTNDGVKNDTYNGQNSGPNRGLGDGGNKPDGSYFSDLGGGGSKTESGGSKTTGEGSGSWGKSGATEARDKPIILDLDGDGIEITELSRSNVFMDSGGDGLLHGTAWAWAGDGMLFFDANGDNKIGETREYVFTEWGPTAASDLAALRSAFDTNGNGRRTSTP